MVQEPKDQGSDDVDRREFLNWSWRVLGVALVVEAGWTSYDLLNPSPAQMGVSM
jgi:hypothetical protein